MNEHLQNLLTWTRDRKAALQREMESFKNANRAAYEELTAVEDWAEWMIAQEKKLREVT